MKNNLLYFAYGSNLNLEQMKNRCPDSVPVAKVKLKGYQLNFNRVADIVKKKNGVAQGAVYQVSPDDIKRLDIYEGYPNYYTKIQVLVEDEDKNRYEAFAYVMTSKGSEEPSPHYYNIIRQGYEDWRLPLQSFNNACSRCRQLEGQAVGD
jgi:gamma-glutamylcyclotransferase (GGCT)/AIG2-like uncharacterized protein YtfP